MRTLVHYCVRLASLSHNSHRRYKIGEAFVHMPKSQAVERLEKDLATVEAESSSLSASADDTKEKMDELKRVLYAKFGQAINLDE